MRTRQRFTRIGCGATMLVLSFFATSTGVAGPALRVGWKPRLVFEARGSGGQVAVQFTADPRDDTFGERAFQPDVVFLGAEITDLDLILRMTFDQEIPTGETFAALIDIDSDRDPNTGLPGLYEEFCASGGTSGVERVVAVGFPESGPAVVFYRADLEEGPPNPLGSGSAVLRGRSAEVTVPLDLIGGDRNGYDLHVVVGTVEEPTDCVPEDGFLGAQRVTPVPLGYGGALLLGVLVAALGTVLLWRRGRLRPGATV